MKQDAAMSDEAWEEIGDIGSTIAGTALDMVWKGELGGSHTDSSHPAAGIAAAVVRHSRRRCRLGIQTFLFLGDGEEARTDSKRSLDEAFLLGRLGKAAQASAPLGAKLAGGWSREFG